MTPRRFRSICLLSPAAVTGGPEAICQLRQILENMGLEARILLYADPRDIRVEPGRITSPPCSWSGHEVYARYQPVTVSEHALDGDTLLILPETRVELYPKLGGAPVAVWWLSTTNAFYPGSRLRKDTDPAFRKWFFQQQDILHLAQSFHSRATIMELGTRSDQIFDLVDYTDERFTAHKPAAPNTGLEIAYNPAKGETESAAFFAAHPEFTPRPIRGMSKDEVLETLRNTQIYVEFGLNPGKDRLPREAACAGAIVLAMGEGGSRLFEDMPVCSGQKFPCASCFDGALAARLHKIRSNPQAHWEKQAYYRNYLRTERELMTLQAKRIFDL